MRPVGLGSRPLAPRKPGAETRDRVEFGMVSLEFRKAEGQDQGGQPARL